MSEEGSETADTVVDALSWHNGQAKKEDEIHVTADMICEYNAAYISELGKRKNTRRHAKAPLKQQFLRKDEIVYLKPRPEGGGIRRVSNRKKTKRRRKS